VQQAASGAGVHFFQQFRFQTGQTFIIRAGFNNPAKPKLFPPFSRFSGAGLKQNGNSSA
jgi:hypothetical protein